MIAAPHPLTPTLSVLARECFTQTFGHLTRRAI